MTKEEHWVRRMEMSFIKGQGMDQYHDAERGFEVTSATLQLREQCEKSDK